MSVSAAIFARLVAVRTNVQVLTVRTDSASGRIQSMTEHEAPSTHNLVLGILGGTGDQGRGLARRFALAGNPVIIGSRSEERARAAAGQIGQDVRGLANRDAAREASVVIAAVPWE